MKGKILKFVLACVFSLSFVFYVFAKEEKKETVTVNFEYKNKTSEADFLNLYVLLNKICNDLKIDKKSFDNFKQLAFCPNQPIKLNGKIYLNLNSNEKQSLKNELEKKDISKVKFNKEEFLKSKQELISSIEKEVKEIEKSSKDINKDFLKVLKNRIEKIKKANFDEVLNLTKDLKVEKF